MAHAAARTRWRGVGAAVPDPVFSTDHEGVETLDGCLPCLVGRTISNQRRRPQFIRHATARTPASFIVRARAAYSWRGRISVLALSKDKRDHRSSYARHTGN